MAKKEKAKNEHSGQGGRNMGSRIGCKSHLKGPFLEQFKKFGVIGEACEKVGVSRRQVYDWRKEDAEFRRKFNEANIHVTELLERSALTRAIFGVDKPVYYQGKKVGTFKELSDTLTIFLLKVRDKRYRQLYGKFDVKFVQGMIEGLTRVVHKNVPEMCPHCNTALAIRPAIAKDLMDLSKKLEESGG